jgi:hypothetical protein
VFINSGCLGYHPVAVQLHYRHTQVFVMESVPNVVLIAQYPFGLVADSVPGKPKVSVGVRWIWWGTRMSKTDLHGEYRRTRRRISCTLQCLIIIIIIIIYNVIINKPHFCTTLRRLYIQSGNGDECITKYIFCIGIDFVHKPEATTIKHKYAMLYCK